MVVLVAKYLAEPGKGDAVEAALLEMSALVKAHEPGCAVYEVNRSRENPHEFLLYERYRDQATFEAHRVTPHFKTIVEGRILPLLVRRDRSIYRNVSA